MARDIFSDMTRNGWLTLVIMLAFCVLWLSLVRMG